MAETPKTIVVRLDVRGAGEEFLRVVRRMVLVRPPLPRRRPLWRRILRRRKN